MTGSGMVHQTINDLKKNEMKNYIHILAKRLSLGAMVAALLLSFSIQTMAQDEKAAEEKPAPVKQKPVKNTFMSVWLIDNQTVMVPVKGTLEMDIMHRFGTVNKGYQDFWGLFAPSNIRLGVNYSPIDKLFVGGGITKNKLLWDASAKYSIITQTKGKYPVSVTYYGNVGYDTRKDADGSIFKYGTERLSYFNQILIARKLTDRLSLQVAPSVSHQNSVAGYYTKNDSTGKETFRNMKWDHIAVAVSARYKLTPSMGLMFNYDQPITKHNTNNPTPNLSMGLEFVTSGHSFQLFVTNYYFLNQQQNNLYNKNAPFNYTISEDGTKGKGGKFLIGFNITRLWN